MEAEEREMGDSFLVGLEISHLQCSLLQKKVNQTLSYFSSSEVPADCYSAYCICECVCVFNRAQRGAIKTVLKR